MPSYEIIEKSLYEEMIFEHKNEVKKTHVCMSKSKNKLDRRKYICKCLNVGIILV